MAQLLFFDDEHRYELDGETIPGVTQLTDIYSTMAVREGDALELTLEAAAERGTILHGYLERRIWGGEREAFEIPAAYDGYADAVDLFLSEHSLDPYMTETPLWCTAAGISFAGTPDFVGSFDGDCCVLDWKFVSQVQKTKVGAQLNGYQVLCQYNEIPVKKLYCVQFLPDGTYRLYPAAADTGSFFLCLSVWLEKRKKHPKGGIA